MTAKFNFSLKVIFLFLYFILISSRVFSQQLYIQSLEQAREYIIENKITKAMNKYLSISADTSLKREQQAHGLFLYSMTLWKNLEDIANAKSALETILSSYPETEAAGDALFSLASIETLNMNFEKSIEHLENFTKKFPEHIRSKKANILLKASKNLFKTDSIPVKILLGTSKGAVLYSKNNFYADSTFLNSKKVYASLSPKNTIIINGTDTYKKKILISSKNSPVDFKNNLYQGEIILNEKNGKIETINLLKLGSYLKSVVPSEMPGTWHMEALKAQAVASRTYALFMIEQNKNNTYHLESGILSQVYKGIQNMCEKSSLAVDQTDSKYILFEKKPVLAAFHSNSGGYTEDPVYFWKKNFSYLKPKTDRFSPLNEWNIFFSYNELSEILFNNSAIINKIYISKKTSSGRAAELTVKTNKGNFYFNGEKFREKTDFFTVKSTLFKIDRVKNGIKIRGRGFGHGIGMSQWGAKAMAEKGYSYEQIVRYYYSDKITIVNKLPRSFFNNRGDLLLTKLF